MEPEPLLTFTNLIPATFIKRDNRFVITATINKTQEKCHLHDPGRLTELLLPGAPLLLQPAKGKRKTSYDVIAIKKKHWVFVHSGYHNALTQKLLQEKKISELAHYTSAQREYTYGKSRIDFLLENRHACLLEVKGCTLIQGNLALFPDAPTTRGQRHVNELTHATQKGYQAALLFLVMGNAKLLSPNWETDPHFARALTVAKEKKVHLLAYTIHFHKGHLFLGKKIPVVTNNLTQNILCLQRGDVGNTVRNRMHSFAKLRTGTNEEWFSELCFCILTANASGAMGIKIQEALDKDFLNLPEKKLQEKLKNMGYRFHNRANYISQNRCYHNIKDIILSFHNPQEARDWLVTHVKGMGYKEASHFLRNVGFTEYAILDRHILRCMKNHGLIPSIPQALTPKRYKEIEKVFCDFAKKNGFTTGEIDLYLWYMETNTVLK